MSIAVYGDDISALGIGDHAESRGGSHLYVHIEADIGFGILLLFRPFLCFTMLVERGVGCFGGARCSIAKGEQLTISGIGCVQNISQRTAFFGSYADVGIQLPRSTKKMHIARTKSCGEEGHVYFVGTVVQFEVVARHRKVIVEMLQMTVAQSPRNCSLSFQTIAQSGTIEPKLSGHNGHIGIRDVISNARHRHACRSRTMFKAFKIDILETAEHTAVASGTSFKLVKNSLGICT